MSNGEVLEKEFVRPVRQAVGAMERSDLVWLDTSPEFMGRCPGGGGTIAGAGRLIREAIV